MIGAITVSPVVVQETFHSKLDINVTDERDAICELPEYSTALKLEQAFGGL